MPARIEPGARLMGMLYKGVQDDAPSRIDPETGDLLLTRSQMEQLTVEGRPLYLEHNYEIRPIGEIYRAWFPDSAPDELWVGVQVYGSDRMGPQLTALVNEAARDGTLRDFSIGMEVSLQPGTNRLVQRWLEASLVNRGRYQHRGTHISVRGSGEPGVGSAAAVDRRRAIHVATPAGGGGGGHSAPGQYITTQSANRPVREPYLCVMASAAETPATSTTTTTAAAAAAADAPAATTEPPAAVDGAAAGADGGKHVPLTGDEAKKIAEGHAQLVTERDQLRNENAKLVEMAQRWKEHEAAQRAQYAEAQRTAVEQFMQLNADAPNPEQLRRFVETVASQPDQPELWQAMHNVAEQLRREREVREAREAEFKKLQEEFSNAQQLIEGFRQHQDISVRAGAYSGGFSAGYAGSDLSSAAAAGQKRPRLDELAPSKPFTLESLFEAARDRPQGAARTAAAAAPLVAAESAAVPPAAAASQEQQLLSVQATARSVPAASDAADDDRLPADWLKKIVRGADLSQNHALRESWLRQQTNAAVALEKETKYGQLQWTP